MDKEKVLEIARECGLDYVIDENDHGDDLEAFAAAISAATREECAKPFDQYEAGKWIARVIRNMGKEG